MARVGAAAPGPVAGQRPVQKTLQLEPGGVDDGVAARRPSFGQLPASVAPTPAIPRASTGPSSKRFPRPPVPTLRNFGTAATPQLKPPGPGAPGGLGARPGPLGAPVPPGAPPAPPLPTQPMAAAQSTPHDTGDAYSGDGETIETRVKQALPAPTAPLQATTPGSGEDEEALATVVMAGAAADDVAAQLEAALAERGLGTGLVAPAPAAGRPAREPAPPSGSLPLPSKPTVPQMPASPPGHAGLRPMFGPPPQAPFGQASPSPFGPEPTVDEPAPAGYGAGPLGPAMGLPFQPGSASFGGPAGGSFGAGPPAAAPMPAAPAPLPARPLPPWAVSSQQQLGEMAAAPEDDDRRLRILLVIAIIVLIVVLAAVIVLWLRRMGIIAF